MSPVVSTIAPIFAVIALGSFARRRGFMPPEFVRAGNRLVFYIAIPAMIFRAIARSRLGEQFNPAVIGSCLLAVVAVALLAWFLVRPARLPAGLFGTFVQSSFHGNLGYIGLAVSFYYLGEAGFVQASIIAGFIMILQNLLGVVVLTAAGRRRGDGRPGVAPMVWKVAGNPVILAAATGIAWAAAGLPLPEVLRRSLDIISGLALPMALLIIGASLSFSLLSGRAGMLLVNCVAKLLVLPAVGLGIFRLWGLESAVFLPGLILLAAPTATLTYIMANEMGGDADYAVAVVSATTMASALTITAWLTLAG
ncbi:MAG: AEC family transporter [Deltaproteobacteria bacterium]|nr:AEC family transporter [Candidatus Anaeroferrophillacea bacterium]